MAMPLSALLAVEELAFDHNGPFTLTLRSGECAGLTGPSGSGKTRLLRAIADLDVHTGGVWLEGVACADVAPAAWRRQVGLLPAESAWWHDEVGPHFPAAPSARSLAAVGFGADVLDWRVDRLSSGERQRLAVLRLLCVEPRVLLLDEPTANLDADNAARVEALVEDARRHRRAAVLWVGHDAAQLRRVATRCYRMAPDRLIEEPLAA